MMALSCHNEPQFVDTTFGLSRGDVNYNEEEQHHRREKQDDDAVDFDLKWLLMPCAYKLLTPYIMRHLRN
jgi:hypothetical protein